MKLPTNEECFAMLRAEETPDNIIAHSRLVNRLAVFIAEKMKEKGENVHVELVDKASLLHDVKKWDEIKNKKFSSHGIEGEKLLMSRYPEVAHLVRRHMLYDIIDPGLTTWEEKIVNYADKRVTNDKIVTLAGRFDYLNQRYPPKDPEMRERVKNKFFELEKEIFSVIRIDPDRVEEYMK